MDMRWKPIISVMGYRYKWVDVLGVKGQHRIKFGDTGSIVVVTLLYDVMVSSDCS